MVYSRTVAVTGRTTTSSLIGTYRTHEMPVYLLHDIFYPHFYRLARL